MKPHLLLTCLALQCSWALAEDAYYDVPLASLTFLEGQLPSHFDWKGSNWKMAEAVQRYATVDGEGEAYLSSEMAQPWTASPQPAYQNTFLTLRAPKTQTLIASLFVPKPDFTGMVALKFKVDPASEKPDSKQEFFKAKENY